jgi:hypothetical protein
MELLLDVREDKVDFFLELLNEFDFVKIVSMIREDAVVESKN